MEEKLIGLLKGLMSLALLLTFFAFFSLVYLISDPGLSTLKDEISSADNSDSMQLIIKDGIHTATGLLDGKGLSLVINNCTNCHSAKLIIQNKMNRDRWLATIRWMQETQNLWDLGENETIILDYLATHYAPSETGRRKNLTDIEWYELKR